MWNWLFILWFIQRRTTWSQIQIGLCVCSLMETINCYTQLDVWWDWVKGACFLSSKIGTKILRCTLGVTCLVCCLSQPSVFFKMAPDPTTYRWTYEPHSWSRNRATVACPNTQNKPLIDVVLGAWDGGQLTRDTTFNVLTSMTSRERGWSHISMGHRNLTPTLEPGQWHYCSLEPVRQGPTGQADKLDYLKASLLKAIGYDNDWGWGGLCSWMAAELFIGNCWTKAAMERYLNT